MRHLPLGFRGFAARFGTLAVLLALLLIPLPVAAWGKAGHRAVATLATTLLSAEAQAQVATLLDPGTILAWHLSRMGSVVMVGMVEMIPSSFSVQIPPFYRKQRIRRNSPNNPTISTVVAR